MTYVSQIIMVYTLNLYNIVCQLHLNKTEKNKQRHNTPKNKVRKQNKNTSCCQKAAIRTTTTTTKVHGYLKHDYQNLKFSIRAGR